ncbi:hypothetical protein ACWGH5_39075 [Streptomyces sp. NPDC054864]
MASTQRVVTGEDVTWTVLGDDYRVVEAIEQYLEYLEYLEYLRSRDCSPDTLKSYARGLALWTFLEQAAGPT